MNSRRIAVALSGGVDSSVAAALLVEQQEDIFGVMLRLDETVEGRNRCCSPADMALARQVASQLGIPFYVLPAADAFREHVVGVFLNGYAQGVTPNPCLVCNRTIRWGLLLNQALALGATHLATGHYARTDASAMPVRLLRGRDPAKDQSYVLAFLDQAQLAHALFPLGQRTKEETRAIARRLRLPVADRAESQDLCFLPPQGYRAFLRQQLGPLPAGPILDQHGTQIGQHSGLADYTIGQRKGIGISGPQPLYVLRKDPDHNSLVVGPRAALARDRFRIAQASWITGTAPAPGTRMTVRVRYHDHEVSADFVGEPARGDVQLTEPLMQIAPGQAAVFYAGEECLGGGIIQP